MKTERNTKFILLIYSFALTLNLFKRWERNGKQEKNFLHCRGASYVRPQVKLRKNGEISKCFRKKHGEISFFYYFPIPVSSFSAALPMRRESKWRSLSYNVFSISSKFNWPFFPKFSKFIKRFSPKISKFRYYELSCLLSFFLRVGERSSGIAGKAML